MNISVIGAGAWGTTLAIMLAENKHEVTLWAYEPELVASLKEFRENKKFLPGFPLGKTIRLTGSPQAAADAEIFFLAVPTPFLRRVAGHFSTIIGEAANKVQACLMNERFRVYTNADPIGVQLGGALKNVIAIAAGVADGLKLGDNAKAGLLIRGMAEIARLGAVMGARPETFAGLSGLGDLITTCSSKLSRNHQVGEKLAAGMKLADILKEMTAVAEGAPTAAAARALGKKLSIPLPIFEEGF